MVTKTSAEAQSRLEEIIDLAQQEPVAVTVKGRPAAYIVSPRDMEELMSLKGKRSKAVKDFEAWREKYKDQISPEAAKLTDEEVNRMVHEAREEIRKEAQIPR